MPLINKIARFSFFIMLGLVRMRSNLYNFQQKHCKREQIP